MSAYATFPGIARDRAHSYGRYRIDGTGVTVVVLNDRHRAGESYADLAREYDLPPEWIEAAIEWHRHRHPRRPA